MVTGGLFQIYRWLLSLMEPVVPARMVLLDLVLLQISMSRYESWSDIAVFFRLACVPAILVKWYFWWALFELLSIRSAANRMGVEDEVGHWTSWKDQGYDSCVSVWIGLIFGTFVEAARQLAQPHLLPLVSKGSFCQARFS
jgi:hypothetical protein